MILYDLSEQDYHSRPELSSTGARSLLPEYKGSPKKFRWQQTHPRRSDTFDVGSAVHAKVLGVGQLVAVIPDEHLTPSGSVSTKAATREWVDEQRASGWAVIPPDVAAQLDAISEAVLSHPDARLMFEAAQRREVSVFGTVGGVECRARFDALSDPSTEQVLGVDLKTTLDATRAGFELSATKWGYDFQAVFYDEVFEASEGRPLDRFVFVMVEKEPPYEVGVFFLEPFWVEKVRQKTARARDVFLESVESGTWPGYPTGVQEVLMPTGHLYRHEAMYDSGEIRV